MRSSNLLTHFSDGWLFDHTVDVWDRSITVIVNDPATKQSYLLKFLHCKDIRYQFIDYDDESNVDMSNVEILEELVSKLTEVRMFRWKFEDDSILTILCKDFWMEPTDGYDEGWSKEL